MSPETRADVVEEPKESRTEKEKKRKSENETRSSSVRADADSDASGGFQSPCATSRGFEMDERVLVWIYPAGKLSEAQRNSGSFLDARASVGRWKVSG